MFLSAASTSALTLSILAVLFRNHFLVARSKYGTGANMAGTVIGAMILGAGMAIGGACPGMVCI